jgi:hypothetical protein
MTPVFFMLYFWKEAGGYLQVQHSQSIYPIRISLKNEA